MTLTACELTTQRRLTVIKSSAFPNPYNPNIDCKYVIKRQSENTCSVTFLFNVFDLQRSENCDKDYLSIEGERICGSQPIGFTRTVQFSEVEEKIVMTFHSDNVTSGVGFMVTVVQQECPSPACDKNFTEIQFDMKSPKFPFSYDNRQNCIYTILKNNPNVCRLKFEVRSFDVEDGERCEADYFEVNGDRLCGILLEGQIVDVDFSGDILIARFHSDDVTTRDGFHFEVTQEECADISPVSLQKRTSVQEPITIANDNVTSVENGADITTIVLTTTD